MAIPKNLLDTGKSLHTASGSKQVGASQARIESQENVEAAEQNQERASMNSMARKDSQNRPHPSVRVTSKQGKASSSYGPSTKGAHIIRETSHGPITRDERGLKLHPRGAYGGGGGAIRKGSNQPQYAQFPMKVQNLNSLVQIRKKRPKMKYNERVAMEAE